MKLLVFITSILLTQATFANNNCASKNSELTNIQGLLSKINPWGTWTGNYNGKGLTLKLSKGSNGFSGKANYDGSNYGPEAISLCDYGNHFSVILMDYEAPVEILGSKKIRITSPLGGGETVILNKN